MIPPPDTHFLKTYSTHPATGFSNCHMETIDPSLLTQPSLYAAVQVMYADGRQNTYTLRDDELITVRIHKAREKPCC